MENEPLVSIGVPVYNDAPRLRNALDHLIKQDYPSLEIILADDGSTDGSREICREYARRDSRIRYFENHQNLGAVNNHRLVIELSKGDYFTWGTGHDYFQITFVSQTLNILKANPSVLLCCPRSVFVDEDGQVVRTPIGGLDTRGLPPVERFKKVLAHLTGGGTANIFYGLYRRKTLAQVDFSRKVIGCDAIMLGELSLLGDIVQIDEILYHRFKHADTSGSKRVKRHQAYLLVMDQSHLEALSPYLSMIYEYLKMVESCNLTDPEKQSLIEAIKGESNRIRPIIMNEIECVIEAADKLLKQQEPYPGLRQYWASRILDILNKAWMLGYDIPNIHQVRSKCLKGLDLGTEAKAAVFHEKMRGFSKKAVLIWEKCKKTFLYVRET